MRILLQQSVVTTTRHKRLGSPSENCSVMRLGIGEDGAKVLNIEQSQSSRRAEQQPRPSSLFLPPPHLFKSNSAYCTQIPPEAAGSRFEAAAPFEAAPGYSSLPSWYGGLRQPPMLPLLFLEAAKALELESAAGAAPPQMVYNSHPADEEKRLAFTRGTALLPCVPVYETSHVLEVPLTRHITLSHLDFDGANQRAIYRVIQTTNLTYSEYILHTYAQTDE